MARTHLQQLWARLPALTRDTDSSDVDLPSVGLAPFSDDLELPGGRLAVRLSIRDDGQGCYVFDFRDSEGAQAPGADRFVVGLDRVRTVCTLAVAHALSIPATAHLATRVSVHCEPGSWIGGATESGDPVGLAFTMARVWDCVLGALAHAWPSRVGAGSCSLGAVVTLCEGDQTWLEVLPGGEGAGPERAGRNAWDGPILATSYLAEGRCPDGLRLDLQPREGSGGGGARPGGDGVVRTYRCARPLEIEVAIDRRTNPPHGIDRAGPPRGSELFIELPGDVRKPIAPWRPFTLQPGETLVVETCGGAGHGFPGWGVDWDPASWQP